MDSGVTLFMLLQAGLAILLSKLGAGDDIAIGSPIAGRNDGALEELVGFFVNTLVLRTNLEGNPRVEEVLAQARRTCLDAYAHQDLPFEHVVELLNPARTQAHAPLFQVMLALQNHETIRLDLPDLRVERVSVETRQAKFDITINLGESTDGLEGEIEYATDLFDESSMERLAVRYVRVLELIVSDPKRYVWEMDVLSVEERRQVVEEWNRTERVKGKEEGRTLPELFEEQVRKTPGATAVVFEERELSYAELNGRANRMAHYLMGRGIGAEDIVAIALRVRWSWW